MIDIRHVNKRYPNGYQALHDINLQLASGEFAFLTGHSGAGKSTLLKLIAALEPASSGSIRVANYVLEKLPPRRRPELRRQVGMILQTPNLLTHKTVFDNVALPLVIAGYSAKDIATRVRAVLAKVSLLDRENFFPYELSGGEQQRVAIARAVINKPAVLLADEPTGNLDPDLASEIMQLFAQFSRSGMTVLIASHDLALIQQLQFPQYILQEGTLSHESASA